MWVKIKRVYKEKKTWEKENEIDAKSLTTSHRQILTPSLSKRLENT